ncbi:hypothetical protein Hamer_G016694 [Homarus americanus]|uniref:Uncharacterized protein n=1 Tax=Homarus americanus TaxID=6706 RepID=A0A8J5TM21_HOMAM|nr:hypothetical protein Hamer_G016694 [Homarus americanus]
MWLWDVTNSRRRALKTSRRGDIVLVVLGGRTLRSDTQSWRRRRVAGHDQNIAVIFDIVDIFIRQSKVEGIKVYVFQILS